MDTPIEIRSSVICNHLSGMKPKEIAMEFNLLHRIVADLIKKGKGARSMIQEKSRRTQKLTRPILFMFLRSIKKIWQKGQTKC